jgi:hypothetical protein
MRSLGSIGKLCLAGLLAVLAACHHDSEPRVKAGDGYAAVIAWAVERQFPNRAPDDPAPLVYVTTIDGSTIGASTQAKVTREAGSKLKVNFVDKREDAIDSKSPVEAVKDDGLLVSVGPLPGDARSSVQLPVEMYANYVDNSSWELLLVADSTGVKVTQEEELKPAG